MKLLLKISYNIVLHIGVLLTFPYHAYRLWKRGRFFLWSALQRFAFYDKKISEQMEKPYDLWIHAVSVGEVQIAKVIIEELHQEHPQLRVMISTTTATGYAMAKSLVCSHITLIYNPIDFFFSVHHAFNKIRPKLLVLVESEIWPNLIWEAKRRSIPVYLINARLSQRTERSYRRFHRLVRPILQEISLVFAQSEEDISRLVNAGFLSQSIFLSGSMKYDVANLPQKNQHKLNTLFSHCGWKEGALTILAASTHVGEEELFLKAYISLQKKIPSLQLVIAPRHAERGQEISRKVHWEGLTPILRTDVYSKDSNHDKLATPKVLILNTTGELRSLYSKVSLAIIGKSFRAKGGQNFIEAAQAGAPIIVGHYMENFLSLVSQFLEHKALLQIGEEELIPTLEDLLKHPEKCKKIGENARNLFMKNCGAGKKTAQALSSFFSSSL